MAGAVREISVHRGFDPRDFALMPFGGAGPLHAFLVAAELGMRRVIISVSGSRLCARTHVRRLPSRLRVTILGNAGRQGTTGDCRGHEQAGQQGTLS